MRVLFNTSLSKLGKSIHCTMYVYFYKRHSSLFWINRPWLHKKRQQRRRNTHESIQSKLCPLSWKLAWSSWMLLKTWCIKKRPFNFPPYMWKYWNLKWPLLCNKFRVKIDELFKLMVHISPVLWSSSWWGLSPCMGRHLSVCLSIRNIILRQNVTGGALKTIRL